MYEFIQCKIVGIAPILMHNAQLADPMNAIAKAMKEITAKGKKKTDADLFELSRLEFIGGLYVNKAGHPIVPGENIESMIRDGAKKTRNGKDVQCGVISDGNWELQYDGPKTSDGLLADDSFRDFRPAVVNRGRVMRTRPRFNEWSLDFEVAYLPEVVNERELVKWIETAGRLCGLLDGRPRFGRFTLDSAQAIKKAA